MALPLHAPYVRAMGGRIVIACLCGIYRSHGVDSVSNFEDSRKNSIFARFLYDNEKWYSSVYIFI